jgi:serine protease Do
MSKALLLLSFVLCASVAAANPYAQEPGFAAVAERLKDSVVTISTAAKQAKPATLQQPNAKGRRKKPDAAPESQSGDFFNRQDEGGIGPGSSVGSGFVADPSGLILTNNHVIEGGEEIYATFQDGSRLKVEKVIGRDLKTDLTLLKVAVPSGKALKAVRFGDSSLMRVGDWVIAIGNPYGLGGTFTVGIVSATGRDINAGPYDDFLQTDAAINRGNSGGPLINAAGEVIGVNTAIISPTGGSIGLGFAVPSNAAKRVFEQLQRYGEIRRGWIGVRVQSINEDIATSLGLYKPAGALVAGVSENGPAALAGIREGDVILAYNGIDIRSSRQLPRYVAQTDVDQQVAVDVLRAGERKTVMLTVARLDDSGMVPVQAQPPLPPEPGKPGKQPLSGIEVAPLTEHLRMAYSLNQDAEGVVVIAPRAGDHGSLVIQEGDVIVEAAHQKVRTVTELEERLSVLRGLERKQALLTIQRYDGQLSFVSVDLAIHGEDGNGSGEAPQD